MNRYINQIISKLKCSRKRRKEIKEQLLSEFTSGLEDGKTVQEIIDQIGLPNEVADEFNNNFSDSEFKKHRNEILLTVLVVVGLIVAAIVGFIWWSLPKQIWIEDSRIFDKETVMSQAETVIDLLDKDDYDALKEICDEKMKMVLEQNDLRDGKALIGPDWGARQSVGNTYIVELTQSGKKSAIVQMHAAYENANVMYTIYFNQDMELEGLWMQ
ncbi:MAG: DUF3887 domain-containing protein [Coprococcus sp.]|nr:DUF3887 domain-containing protein [Coprococcus sp.]